MGLFGLGDKKDDAQAAAPAAPASDASSAMPPAGGDMGATADASMGSDPMGVAPAAPEVGAVPEAEAPAVPDMGASAATATEEPAAPVDPTVPPAGGAMPQ